MTSIPWLTQKILFLLLAGYTLYVLFQAGFSEGYYSLPGFSGLRFSDPDRNATLGVAKKLYVLSLPHRTDRRNEMEKLKKALGLKWKYIDALNMASSMVGKIMDSVRAVRATENGPFIWPEMPSPNQHLSPFSPGFISLSAKFFHNSEADPLVCAEKNNSIAPYEPDLPEFRILTSARVACWYSHTSVIASVANDRSLKDNDTVIVLEDDVDMELDIHARLRHLWTFLPEQWDIVHLGHCWSDETYYPALNANDIPATPNSSLTYIHPSRTPGCNHGYALTRAGARRILVHLRYTPFAYSRAIDLAISWLVQTDRIKSFSIYPSIVVQRKNTDSDIMPGMGNDWSDKLVNGVYANLEDVPS